MSAPLLLEKPWRPLTFHTEPTSIFVLTIGAFIPLWILPSSFGALSAGAFWIQFGVQGAWGVVSTALSGVGAGADGDRGRFQSSSRRCPRLRSVRRSPVSRTRSET